MTEPQLKRLEILYSQIAEFSKEIKKLEAEVRAFRQQCDHLNPDGTSAVEFWLGVMGYCKICNLNNDHGNLDDHLSQYHGVVKRSS